MKQHFKYKGLVLACIALLNTVAASVALTTPVALANPLNHFADITCPAGQAPFTNKSTQTACCPSGQTIEDNSPTCCPTGTSTSNNSCLFAKYINPLIQLLSATVGVVAVLIIIYGSVEYTTSAGDPQKAANGKRHIVGALIGLLAYLMLYAFLQFITPGGLLNV
jgi:hypothetical protein